MNVHEKDVDFDRIIKAPHREIGDKTIEFLTDYAINNNCNKYKALKDCVNNGTLKRGKAQAQKFIDLIDNLKKNYKNMSVLEVVNTILDKTGYIMELDKNNEQDRLENIEELKHGIIEFQNVDIEEKTLEEYLDKVALFTDVDRTSKESAVKLMTIHASKGLEFKNVFMINLNEGVLPSDKVKTNEEIEEERRLCYVAITRAKDRLYLTDVKSAYNSDMAEPSRFLREIDKNELEFVGKDTEQRLCDTSENCVNASINNNEMFFKVGDKIKHIAFGIGVIQAIDYEKKMYSIKYDKFDTIRTITANMKLEKVE